MQVSCFYSPLRGIGLDVAWHDDDECAIGRSIAITDRIAGKGHNIAHCVYCALLGPGRFWPELKQAAGRSHP